MREAIGGAWIYALVMIFMMIFVSYLAISLNHTRAFMTKDEVVRIIELNEGFNNRSREIIENYLYSAGYRVRGFCDNDRMMEDRSARGEGIGPDGNGRFLYCINGPFLTRDSTEVRPVGYYTVTLFFRFDLPVIGNILTFPVTGRTRPIHHLNDS